MALGGRLLLNQQLFKLHSCANSRIPRSLPVAVKPPRSSSSSGTSSCGNVAPANAIDAFEQLAQYRTDISGGTDYKDVLYSRFPGYNASSHDRL